MEVGKLFKTTKDLTEKIQNSSLDSHFARAVQHIQRLTQQAQTPIQNRQQYLDIIDSERSEILAAIRTFIPAHLSVEDSKVYDSVGAYSLFGFEGQQRFNAIFKDVKSNPENTKQLLQSYQQEISKITQLHSSLNQFSDTVNVENDNLESSDLIILFFQGGSEINNLDELAKVSAKWNQVLIAFALLSKENDTSFRIETVERGSIIITLSAIAGIVYAFARAAEKVLDTIKKYYEIKKLAHEASQLKGFPEKTVQDIENSSKLKVKAETNEITKELIEEFDWQEEDQRKDIDVAVRMAVRHLLEFVNKGGKVDVKLIAQNTENRQIEINMALKYNEIKEIEETISPNGEQKQKLELNEGESDEEEETA